MAKQSVTSLKSRVALWQSQVSKLRAYERNGILTRSLYLELERAKRALASRQRALYRQTRRA